jgi:tRNA/rRNA methyltransferase
MRIVVELVPGNESAESGQARSERRQWLTDRNYQVIEIAAADVEKDVSAILDRLAAAVANADLPS